ncbi:HBS1-like protein [Cladochytrium tenue]|nr:HBS1-like protein [Cladochytrium tenue]
MSDKEDGNPMALFQWSGQPYAHLSDEESAHLDAVSFTFASGDVPNHALDINGGWYQAEAGVHVSTAVTSEVHDTEALRVLACLAIKRALPVTEICCACPCPPESLDLSRAGHVSERVLYQFVPWRTLARLLPDFAGSLSNAINQTVKMPHMSVGTPHSLVSLRLSLTADQILGNTFTAVFLAPENSSLGRHWLKRPPFSELQPSAPLRDLAVSATLAPTIGFHPHIRIVVDQTHGPKVEEGYHLALLMPSTASAFFDPFQLEGVPLPPGVTLLAYGSSVLNLDVPLHMRYQAPVYNSTDYPADIPYPRAFLLSPDAPVPSITTVFDLLGADPFNEVQTGAHIHRARLKYQDGRATDGLHQWTVKVPRGDLEDAFVVAVLTFAVAVGVSLSRHRLVQRGLKYDDYMDDDGYDEDYEDEEYNAGDDDPDISIKAYVAPGSGRGPTQLAQQAKQPSVPITPEMVDEVRVILGDGFDTAVIRDALAKCGGNVEAAVNGLLDGSLAAPVSPALDGPIAGGIDAPADSLEHRARPEEDRVAGDGVASIRLGAKQTQQPPLQPALLSLKSLSAIGRPPAKPEEKKPGSATPSALAGLQSLSRLSAQSTAPLSSTGANLTSLSKLADVSPSAKAGDTAMNLRSLKTVSESSAPPLASTGLSSLSKMAGRAPTPSLAGLAFKANPMPLPTLTGPAQKGNASAAHSTPLTLKQLSAAPSLASLAGLKATTPRTSATPSEPPRAPAAGPVAPQARLLSLLVKPQEAVAAPASGMAQDSTPAVTQRQSATSPPDHQRGSPTRNLRLRGLVAAPSRLAAGWLEVGEDADGQQQQKRREEKGVLDVSQERVRRILAELPRTIPKSLHDFQPFRFDTASPDDVVLAARKGSGVGPKPAANKPAASMSITPKKQKAATPSTQGKQGGAGQHKSTTAGSSSSIGPKAAAVGASGTKKLADSMQSLKLGDSAPATPPPARTRKIDVAAEFAKRAAEKESLNIVVIGHVDAGKSTLMGHMLQLLGVVDERTIRKYERDAEKMKKGSFAYAWVLDATDEERARGVTIDVGVSSFETPHRRFTLLDAPGHRDFVPNMIAGASQADVAMLVVDSATGDFEAGFEAGGQTREHALLVRSLGVSQLVVAVNQMDTVNWSQERFDEIRGKLDAFLIGQAGFKRDKVVFIPCSGYTGENLLRREHPDLSSWFNGPTIAEALDTLEAPRRALDGSFRLCATDVFKGAASMGGTGGASVSVSGRVDGGTVQLGDTVAVLPGSERGVVKGKLLSQPAAIEFQDESVKWAVAGDLVTIGLAGVDIQNISTGSVLCDPSQPVTTATRFAARVVTFELAVPLTPGTPLVMHHAGGARDPASLQRIGALLARASGALLRKNPRALPGHSSADVVVRTERAVCVLPAAESRDLGRFTLRAGSAVVAAGLVTEVLKHSKAMSDAAAANANRDEARRCLDLSKARFAAGDTAAAIKFAKKSVALAGLPEADEWLQFIERQRGGASAASSSSASSSSSTPAASRAESSSSSLSSSSAADAARPFTPEQVDGIRRIREMKTKGDLYGVLGLQKGCSESDIKKAYRKLALQFHPDKCGAPGTDEAFKAIGHSFAVLGDEGKREQYDRYDIDPDSAAGRSAAAGGGGGPAAAFQRGGFGDEISPEELFNMFFGGDLGGEAGFHFAAGPHFRRQFRFQDNAAFRRRQHQHQQQQQQQPANGLQQLAQMAPLLLFLLISLLSSISSLFPSSSSNLPSYSFERTRTNSVPRATGLHAVAYFVNGDEFARRGVEGNPARLRAFEDAIEMQMHHSLQMRCRHEREYKTQEIAMSYNLLFGTDAKRLRRAEQLETPSCDRLVAWERISREAAAAAAKKPRGAAAVAGGGGGVSGGGGSGAGEL